MLDIRIDNGVIFDGTGSPPGSGSIGIADGKIVAVGVSDTVAARQTIDAAGRYVTPGFIDVHRHADAALFRPTFGELELRQGLTTIVNGNCGLSLAPVTEPNRTDLIRYLSPILGTADDTPVCRRMDEYLTAVSQSCPPLHIANLTGGGTLRASAAGFSSGALTEDQLQQIHIEMEQALADGAFGISLGLGYAPECFYSTEQLIDVLAPLRDSGKILTVHMRQEGDGVVNALREMLTVAKALRIPVEISHLKAIGVRNHRKAVPEMLSLLRQARQDNVDVTCDVYPYTAGSTQLLHILPPEVGKDGTAALVRRLTDSASRRELRHRMETGRDFENISLLMGFDNIYVTAVMTERNRPLEGKSLTEIASLRGTDPYTAAFDLLAEEQGNVAMIDVITAQADIDDILQEPYAGVISDATYPLGGQLHPRVAGTFARLMEDVVGRGVLTLTDAVYRVTGRAAKRFGLRKKGCITAGYDADLCIFDPANVREIGTYLAPNRPAVGFDWVIVNGQPAIAEGRFTGIRAGAVLRA